MTRRGAAAWMCAALLATGCRPKGSSYLILWCADADAKESDFLAVVDVRPNSASYARVIASLPVGKKDTAPHHTEHELDASGLLFANGFGSGDTFLFDLREPERPRLLKSFAPPAPFTQPHSYVRIPGGGVLMTLQTRGEGHEEPGAIAELDAGGRVLRVVPAADDKVDPRILPYSLAVVPRLDRVVSTSADMHARWVSRVVQVWRLSDLARVSTIVLPHGPGGKEGWDPAEPRVLADGETVLVSTFNCGLYRLRDLGTSAPRAEFIHGFGGGDCALPVVVGKFWIQTVPDAHSLVALDVSDPGRPREVGRLAIGPEFRPHWIAAERGGRRIVLTGYGPRVLLISLDPATGALAIIESFRDQGAVVPGIRMDGEGWPHGSSGEAVPHGAVFSLE